MVAQFMHLKTENKIFYKLYYFVNGYSSSFSQIYLRKDNSTVSLMEGTLLAVGGRYDYLVHYMSDSEHVGVKLTIPFLFMLFLCKIV